MAVSCNPSDIVKAAKCFTCIPKSMRPAVKSSLLCQVLNIATPPCVTPNAPNFSSLARDPSVPDKLQASWKQFANNGTLIVGYIVKWGTVSGVYTNSSGILPLAPKTYTITGLTGGTTYFVVIVAVGAVAGCNSANSNERSNTTGGNPPNNLLTGLVHYFKFDAQNAQFGVDDFVGTMNTFATNVGADMSLNAGGIINNCISCTGTGTVNQIEFNSPTPLDIKALFAGNGSITIAVWGWLDTAVSQTAGFPILASVFGPAGGDKFWYLSVNNGTNTIRWIMINSVGAQIELDWTAPLSSRQAWHLFVVGYDGALGKMFISVDNGTLAYGGAFTPAVNTNNGFFGFFNGNSANNEWRGRADESGIWNPRALSQSDINTLWNGGAGLPLSSFM